MTNATLLPASSFAFGAAKHCADMPGAAAATKGEEAGEAQEADKAGQERGRGSAE